MSACTSSDNFEKTEKGAQPVSLTDLKLLADFIRKNPNILEMTGNVSEGNTINGRRVLFDADEFEKRRDEDGLFYYLSVLKDEAVETMDFKQMRNGMIKQKLKQYFRKPQHTVFISDREKDQIAGYIVTHDGKEVTSLYLNKNFTLTPKYKIDDKVYYFEAVKNN